METSNGSRFSVLQLSHRDVNRVKEILRRARLMARLIRIGNRNDNSLLRKPLILPETLYRLKSRLRRSRNTATSCALSDNVKRDYYSRAYRSLNELSLVGPARPTLYIDYRD